MRCLLSLLFLSTFSFSFSQEVIFTDRPNVTDAVAVLNKGTFQVEAGYLANKSGEGPSETTFTTIPNLSFKYGLSDKIELRVLTNYATLDNGGADISGLTPITISPKFALLEQDGIIPKTTLALALTFPDVGEEAFQVQDVNYNFRGLFEYNFDFITWTNSIGMDFIDNNENVLAWTTVLGKSVTEKLGLFFELYGYEGDGYSAQNIDFGLTYIVNNDLQVDFIYGLNVDSNADSSILGFGLAYKFN